MSYKKPQSLNCANSAAPGQSIVIALGQIRVRSSLGSIIRPTGMGLPFPDGAFTVPV